MQFIKIKYTYNMATRAVKITKKGQVTSPKEIRESLGTSSVYFELIDGNVVVRPLKDAAGSLSAYARNVDPPAQMNELEEKAWKEAIYEKFGDRPT